LDTLLNYGVPTPTGWFPNGVDFDYFTPEVVDYDPNAICFVGRMDYYPNQEAMIDFCRHVMPALRARIPAIKLSIIGAEPSAEIRRLGELPGVTVTGTVADIRPLVRQSAAAIAPLHIARGTQNKMLECMAMGVPVVCSRLTLRGVDAVDGEHLLAADSPQEYTEAIAGLLSNPERRAALAKAGRQRMIERHSWSKSMQHLDSIIERCCKGYPGRMEAREVLA
jgi:glycosyltransferase involved in cell wall biosynthesis